VYVLEGDTDVSSKLLSVVVRSGAPSRRTVYRMAPRLAPLPSGRFQRNPTTSAFVHSARNAIDAAERVAAGRCPVDTQPLRTPRASTHRNVSARCWPRLGAGAKLEVGLVLLPIEVKGMSVGSVSEITPGPQRGEGVTLEQRDTRNAVEFYRSALRDVIPAEAEMAALAQPRVAL
jgi:hypothetical protein